MSSHNRLATRFAQGSLASIRDTLGFMRRLLTPAWLARHGLTVTLVAGFLALGWWQIDRAASGNTLSWAYAIEWPVFAAFVIFVWWREVRREFHAGPATASPERSRPDDEPEAVGIRRPVLVRPGIGHGETATLCENEVELAAYNKYLAWLNANPGARLQDYPG